MKSYHALAASLFILSGLSGCQSDSALVTYEQVGACNGFVNPSTVAHSAGPHQAFVVFRIRELSAKNSTIPLHFDPTLAFANVTGHPTIDPSLSLSSLFGVLQQPPVTVPAGTIQGSDGLAALTVPTAAADGATEANQTSYFLVYPKQSGEPAVTMSKLNSSQTSWPYTPGCLQIKYPT